jgi:hypothetical protein
VEEGRVVRYAFAYENLTLRELERLKDRANKAYELGIYISIDPSIVLSLIMMIDYLDGQYKQALKDANEAADEWQSLKKLVKRAGLDVTTTGEAGIDWSNIGVP